MLFYKIFYLYLYKKKKRLLNKDDILGKSALLTYLRIRPFLYSLFVLQVKKRR